MLQDIRRYKLGKSGSKFRHGRGRGVSKMAKKFRRLLWTAPCATIQYLNEFGRWICTSPSKDDQSKFPPKKYYSGLHSARLCRQVGLKPTFHLRQLYHHQHIDRFCLEKNVRRIRYNIRSRCPRTSDLIEILFMRTGEKAHGKSKKSPQGVPGSPQEAPRKPPGSPQEAR